MTAFNPAANQRAAGAAKRIAHAAAPTLDDRKRDLPALLDRIGLDRPTLHGVCCFCGGRTAMSCNTNADGVALFECHKCGAAGSIVDADILENGGTVSDAIRRLGVSTGPRLSRPRIAIAPAPRPESPVPVPNDELVYRHFFPAFEAVASGGANDRLAARGIHNIEWFLKHPILGFNVQMNAWVLLVTDARWNYLGLKIHKEKPFTGPKNFWLRCGTQPPENPRHAATGAFYPPVEIFDRDELLYLCPGELKAASILSAGDNATSTCAGESHQWTAGQIELFRGREIAILFDDDDAGRAYRDRTFEALCRVAKQIYKISLGAVRHDD